jgi:hypothetical protein
LGEVDTPILKTGRAHPNTAPAQPHAAASYRASDLVHWPISVVTVVRLESAMRAKADIDRVALKPIYEFAA